MIIFSYFVCLCFFVTPEVLGYRRIKNGGSDLILAKAGEAIDVICEKEVPLVKCGFTHPNGTKILFVDVVPGTPSCKFTTDASASETGFWTCHLWTTSLEEIKKTVEVRAVHKFAAIDKEVAVSEGERVTLSCVSSEGMFPLNECYFTSPEQRRIYNYILMDDKMTEENMVFNKYFYPYNLSVHRGDCSITVLAAELADEGSWACTGWLELENRAYTDYIHLRVNGATITDDNPFGLSILTFISSSIGILVILTAFLYWKKRARLNKNKWGVWSDDESVESYGITADVSAILVRDDK